ncbi:MAG: type II secretion system F family protein [Phycisphaerae bacterium]|nr:type II secretion system F family protein [Phycisphaerae bacterium]
MQFAYEAMRPDGSTVAAQLEAGSRAEAVDALREQGLIVLKLDADARSAAEGASGLQLHSSKITTRDLILFTRQMKMLLESGAPLVPALLATEEQTAKPTVQALLGRLRERVEEGDSLCDALEPERRFFDPVFRSMIATGEATASLPEVFGRLCDLAQQRQQTRKQILGALLYPAILCVLLTGVVGILLLFVVPRFRALFLSLNKPLPGSTKLLFAASEGLKHGWPYLLGGVVVVVVAVILCFRLPGTRRWLDHFVLKLPVVGRLVSRLIFARVVRVWAAMLRSHVPLLEAINQSREAVTNTAFLRLIADVEESVSTGGRMGQSLAATGLADPVIVSAIRTGEENGRLAEATDFVSGWMDEDNATMIQHVTRLAEPLLLVVMGLIVGFVAMSLFLPLFDLATAAG